MGSRPLSIVSICPISLWSPDLNKETAGSQAIALAQEALARAGHKPTLIVVTNSASRRRGGADCYEYRGFQVRRVYMPRWLAFIISKPILDFLTSRHYYFWYYVFAFFSGWRVARREKADVIIGYTFYSAIPAFLISKVLRIPYIYRENGTWDLYADIQTWWGRLKRFDATLAYRLPCAAMILTDDMTQSDRVAGFFGVPKEKIFHWRNGIFKYDPGTKDRDSIRRGFGFSPEHRIMVSVGRMSTEKRFDCIIKAAAMLKAAGNWRLVLVGHGPQAGRLKRLAEELGISNQVIFTGAVANQTVNDYMLAADLVVALGSINPLLEGINAGRCVIALDLGATRQMTDDGRAAVVITEADLPELWRTMNELLNDDGKRRGYEQRALRWAREGIEDWAERIQKEVRLIENIARAKGA